MTTAEGIHTEASDAFDVAIIGMAGRFPGARSVREFWKNLHGGVEALSSFTDEELSAAGVPPAVFKDPQYVRSRGILHDVELFDAGFFGVYPREAETMDPQHRLFLECAWEALEDAGYCTDAYRGLIGVFGGVGMNSYLLNWLSEGGREVAPAEGYQLVIGNEKDFLATRVSYKLNLRGPSVVVQTACSTSLVAVHMACQSLLSYQCDMALAGGVTISLPQNAGYLYQEGMILSPDGHCRAFDAGAQGTVGGNGVGIVLLKRLADALADRDPIVAIIKATACNNDGALRVGYTSPGVEGQASVISAAQELAGVHPETITYIEAHGTGTPLGDPIEVAALTQVFRAKTDRKGFCAIGSVKTNVGHLDAAAGVAGLIKASLALEHRELPPSLHYDVPNPKIDFASSPFVVNATLREWPRMEVPRRAGVSSFGIGGTNVHAILEEAPEVKSEPSQRSWHLLHLSAKSPAALDAATDNMVQFLEEHSSLDIADVAYTLQVGRKPFHHRRIVVGTSAAEVASALAHRDPKRVFSFAHPQDPVSPPVAFMFSGQGSQYAGMARGLYEVEPAFRATVDECAALLQPLLLFDLRQVLFPRPGEESRADDLLGQTSLTQPSLFVIEYALARLLMERGVRPEAMVGHSIGEYVAACLAGVFSRDDALRLVVARGRLMQSMPPGVMLSVPLEENEMRELLGETLSLAALNAPGNCVVSGPGDAIEDLQKRLTERGVESRLLRTSHAFHSAMMDPILEEFTREVSTTVLAPPSIPYLSNVTGTWITASEATDPSYWATHLRQTVRFGDNVRTLLEVKERLLLEVGPGQTLTTLARRQRGAAGRVVLSSLRHPQETAPDDMFLMTALGRLWLAGLKIDVESIYANERRRRLRLPTYPFQRQRYWLDAHSTPAGTHPKEGPPAKRQEVADWLYIPSWRRCDLPRRADKLPLGGEMKWLVFMDDRGLGDRAVRELKRAEQEVAAVYVVNQPGGDRAGVYTINPAIQEAYHWLIQTLAEGGWFPSAILHCWNVGEDVKVAGTGEPGGARRAYGVESLFFLVQALAKHMPENPCEITVVTTGVQEVIGEEEVNPRKALVTGACRVIPQEYPHLRVRTIDLPILDSGGWNTETVRDLLAEMSAPATDVTVAYRGRHRWVQGYEPLGRALDGPPASVLRERGVYLITGGLGRIGLVVAEFLARSARARIALVDRTVLPPRQTWEEWMRSHSPTDAVAGRMEKILEIERLGAEVAVFQANVTGEEEMRSVLREVDRRYGALHGVFHGAGEVGARAIRMIAEIQPDVLESQLQAKLEGTQLLARVLEGRTLDFCFLHSSLASILGGMGFAAYAAANSALDAFAVRMSRKTGTRWVSVNWDAWQDDAHTGGPIVLPEEGVAVIERVLGLSGPPQVVVSMTDLHERLRRWVTREADGAEEGERPGSVPEAPSSLHARPNMQTSYVAPSTDLERQIVEVWGNLLGIGEIGVHDNFFELGGNSLIGTQLASQLRTKFQVELPLRRLFEDPTVSSVARIIEEERLQHGGDAERIAAALRQVQALTEDEAKTRLGVPAGVGANRNG